ncbi:MAG: hypothetical protein ACREV7_21490 [Steroidobacteraceae bacterium]
MSSPSRASISSAVDYGAAKTPYVRSMIAATSWERRAIAADLLRIERCVDLQNAGQLRGFAANVMFHWLRQAYAQQTEIITAEIERGSALSRKQRSAIIARHRHAAKLVSDEHRRQREKEERDERASWAAARVHIHA